MSNISYLATCPIKKQGGLSTIIIKVIGLTHSDGKDSERKCWIKYSEYNNCKEVLDYICSMGPPDLACLPVPSN